jgi:hypothetical protein
MTVTLIGILFLRFQYSNYLDFHGSHFLTLESYDVAKESGSLVAVFRPLPNKKDGLNSPLVFQLATLHLEGSQTYSDEIYLNPTTNLKEDIRTLIIESKEIEVQSGKLNVLSAFKKLPDVVFGLNLHHDTIETYILSESFHKYSDLKSQKSYLKEWKRIIKD